MSPEIIDTRPPVSDKELKETLKHLKKLSEIVVPFRETIQEKEIVDDENGLVAEMRYIYKNGDSSIVQVYIEKGFLHKCHFHQELEVLILLRGRMVRIMPEGEDDIEIGINKPVIIQPYEEHTFYYPEESKVLAITVPASNHFPNE